MATARTPPESEHSMEEDDYIQVIVETETLQGYFFEPEYTEDQLRQRDEEQAAAVAVEAARRAAAAGADEEQPRVGGDSWCLCSNCIPMVTDCCHEFHRAQFLLDELQEELDASGGGPGQPIC